MCCRTWIAVWGGRRVGSIFIHEAVIIYQPLSIEPLESQWTMEKLVVHSSPNKERIRKRTFGRYEKVKQDVGHMNKYKWIVEMCQFRFIFCVSLMDTAFLFDRIARDQFLVYDFLFHEQAATYSRRIPHVIFIIERINVAFFILPANTILIP